MYRLAILTWVGICSTLTCFALELVERSLAPSQGDLCYAAVADVALLEDKLYFMSGRYTFDNGGTNSFDDQLYWLNLNTSFPLDTVLPSNVYHSMAVPGSDWQGNGAFFTDRLMTTMYHLAGYANPDNATVQSFNVTSQTWANVSVSDGSFNCISRGGAAFATSSPSGLGLGFISGGGDAQTPPGLITFDASNPSALSWTNETQGTPHLDLGTMQYARFGNKGVLIAFGGYIDLSTASLYDMSLIHVYDVDSSKWFNITATGNVPLARSEICSVISASPDDSSFQITFFGGYNIHEGTAFEDVYVLAIPAFRWISITSINNGESQLGGNAGRYATSCALYQDRQMFIFGGNLILSGDDVIANAKACNDSWGVIRMLDTTNFQWQTQYIPNSDVYAVPDQVYRVIGGGPSGGATINSPHGGFNNSALSTIFKSTIPRFTSVATTSSPTTSTTTGQSSLPTSSALPSSSSTPSGAIAGGLVGGVAALATLGVLLYVFCFRRRKRDQQQPGDTAQEWKKPELSTHASVSKKNNNDVHEMHADDIRGEIDGNNIVEALSKYPEAKPSVFEMSSSNC